MTRISKAVSYALSFAMATSMVLNSYSVVYAIGTDMPVIVDGDDKDVFGNDEENNSSSEDLLLSGEDGENIKDIKEDEEEGNDQIDGTENESQVSEEGKEEGNNQEPEEIPPVEHTHSYTYAPVDENVHLVICSECEEQAEEAHAFQLDTGYVSFVRIKKKKSRNQNKIPKILKLKLMRKTIKLTPKK